ncbi:hypothetical protein B1R32_1231 [Abditibacterium utsteinense]|uniref:Uncharacterized protein n=1 Tax=Abditibacterium utsteinense TaxID=1960156 RepID=A0A2S8SPJ2_9BACT|nr:hypothetical protein [Abditibacterium utsteinense]PQV62717.1 hypothetical protein B1R32_1231 [Abditibacterium utsteinense]
MKNSMFKLLPLLGTMFVTAPAWAGSWSLAPLEYSGTSSGGPGWGHQGNKMDWAYGGWSGDDGEFQGASTSNFGPGQTQSGSATGHFILVLRWTPSIANETIPLRVGVVIQQTASGGGGRLDRSAMYGLKSATPGTVTLSTQVTTPGGQSFSDSSHLTQRSDGNYYYSSFAQHPPLIAMVGTRNAEVQPNGSYLVRYPLPSVKGTFTVKGGSFEVETG